MKKGEKCFSKHKSKTRDISGCVSPSVKPGTSPEESLSTKYLRRPMTDNRQKYKEVDEIGPHQALDFALFAGQKPSAGDSHFRFAKEKDWDTKERVSDYLKLDIKDLCADIMCIPLHERLKIPATILTSEQIASFTAEAKMNECRRRQLMDPLTEELCNKIVSVLGSEKEKHQDDSYGTSHWLPTDTSKEPTEKQSNQSTWMHEGLEEGAANYFNLRGVEEELDSFLSMPLPANPDGKYIFWGKGVPGAF